MLQKSDLRKGCLCFHRKISKRGELRDKLAGDISSGDLIQTRSGHLRPATLFSFFLPLVLYFMRGKFSLTFFPSLIHRVYTLFSIHIVFYSLWYHPVPSYSIRYHSIMRGKTWVNR